MLVKLYTTLQSIEEFIPLLREWMNVLNPYVRQFLVGWITVLDSVPDIDMLGFLPDFLDAVLLLKSVDYGRMAEILVQRAASPDEFTRWTAITWINEFVKLGGDQLVPYYADILGAILPCIADKEEKIRVVARETNEELLAIQADPAEGFDVGAILSIARRQLSSEHEATRIESLHWISTLLSRHCPEVLTFLNDIFDTLLKSLADPSDQVVLLVLEVHAAIAKDQHNFRQLLVFLVHKFRTDHDLLERRGALIIRQLCVLLDSERVYRELSKILEGETDLDFASTMVQALNLILLASSELFVLRDLFKLSLCTRKAKRWWVRISPVERCNRRHHRYLNNEHRHFRSSSPLKPIGPDANRYMNECWILTAYQHASSVIQSLTEEDINVIFLVQLDKLIHLLETPTFAYLRLQQSAAFKILRTRLKTVPSYSFNNEQVYHTSSGNPSTQTDRHFSEDGSMNNGSSTGHVGS
ncbi:hypothetical protein L1987_06625 [Smallanthus sonchifolius]|uniref:Uncharacterized protein n=1 Tax=Smallanthus sonchifolius TaxID=185202 RepID=A0ACB9JYM6_9ASTR|nr:hypothetical protein L1987_06625 [Smallanthus sonchifolius]